MALTSAVDSPMAAPMTMDATAATVSTTAD